MNKASLCLFGGALLGAGLSNNAIADIHIEDTIEMNSVYFAYDTGSYHYAYGILEVHTIDFTVLSDSYVQIDMLSWGITDAYFDSQIMLFNNDGIPFSYVNHVSTNDDGDPSLDFNGSISDLDSFMDIFLTAGDYTVAVGAFFFDVHDANNGQSISHIFSSIDSATATGGGFYELDIIGDVAGVPAPGALALLGFGGLISTRRRR